MSEPVINIRPNREMQVLTLGLPRTGSASICEALKILGYKEVHHGIGALNLPHEWPVFSAAADACVSSLPSHEPGRTFSTTDWDAIFGPCEAVTDIGSLFGLSVSAYPNAK